uniref:Uncharacterized protein n=1 Tax=Rhizophora mucronata TaxID=61149 RepID=A0A2P2PNT9_RHIMU
MLWIGRPALQFQYFCCVRHTFRESLSEPIRVRELGWSSCH